MKKINILFTNDNEEEEEKKIQKDLMKESKEVLLQINSLLFSLHAVTDDEKRTDFAIKNICDRLATLIALFTFLEDTEKKEIYNLFIEKFKTLEWLIFMQENNLINKKDFITLKQIVELTQEIMNNFNR